MKKPLITREALPLFLQALRDIGLQITDRTVGNLPTVQSIGDLELIAAWAVFSRGDQLTMQHILPDGGVAGWTHMDEVFRLEKVVFTELVNTPVGSSTRIGWFGNLPVIQTASMPEPSLDVPTCIADAAGIAYPTGVGRYCLTLYLAAYYSVEKKAWMLRADSDTWIPNKQVDTLPATAALDPLYDAVLRSVAAQGAAVEANGVDSIHRAVAKLRDSGFADVRANEDTCTICGASPTGEWRFEIKVSI